MPLSPFAAEAVGWFDGITLNNSKEYFNTNKQTYLKFVREPFEALLTELAVEFGGEPYVFRPNRDVRFSPDKRPYKTNVSGYLASRPDTTGDVYLELSADGWFAATGYHDMAADQLSRYRNALTGEDSPKIGTELRNILAKIMSAGYEIEGEQLKTAPKGVDRNSENLDLLRYKSIILTARIPLTPPQDPQEIIHFARQTWHVGDVLNAFLDKHVGKSTALIT